MCVFTMKDVQNAFSGLYKEVNRETQQWYTVTHPVPTPRPGAVSTGCWLLAAWLPTPGWLLCVCFLILEVGAKAPACLSYWVGRGCECWNG